MASRETENNAYAKFWADKQRALWYVIVFSGVANLNLAGMSKFKYERKSEEYSGRSSKMTPSRKWPINFAFT